MQEFEVNVEPNLIVKIHGLKFKTCGTTTNGEHKNLKVDTNSLSPSEIYAGISKIMNDLSSIFENGYINHSNLKLMPVINEFLSFFDIRKEATKGPHASEIYKWIYNIIIIKLYEKTLEISSNQMVDTIDGESENFKTDLSVLSRELYSKLDPSVRNKLLKRGISVIQNSYVGFDSEFKNVNVLENKLISVQMAVNTRTYLKMPIQKDYKLSTVNPLTQASYELSGIPGLKLFEEILNDSIKGIRKMNYSILDEAILKLCTGLKNMGVPFMFKSDMCVFSLPQTKIQPVILYPNTSKDVGGQEGISFEAMVKKSNSMCEPVLKETYADLLNKLREIWNASDQKESHHSAERAIETSAKLEKGYTDEILPLTSPDLPLEGGELKRLSRSFMNSFTGSNVSVSRLRNSYFVAHLTNADLSILSDFEELKKKLDIVNKSFVTLGKPIVIDNTNIFIRDTMLLTPASKKSLDAIGELYGVEKIKLSKDEITNMDVLLQENKERFEEYAQRDVIIPLIHANFMERFNFQLNELGVPITLSNLGQKYVKYI